MIRKATQEDFDFVYGLYMHPQVNPWLLYEPMDENSFRPIFAELLEKKLKYIFLKDDQPAGMFKLVPLLHRTAHVVYLGGLAIHPSFAGHGLGKQMLEEIIDFAKQQGYKRIELSTSIINAKAIRLYEQAGFEKEGLLRNYSYLLSENRYLDEVMMAYLMKNE